MKTIIRAGALWVALTVSVALLANAEPVPIVQSLTITAAVESALGHYPAVQAAVADSRAARAVVRQAKSAWLPTLTLTGAAMRYEKPMVVAPIHGLVLGDFPDFDRTLYQAGAHVQFTLFDGFGRSARIGQAQFVASAADAGATAAMQDVTAAAVSAYLAILTQGDLLAAHDSRLTAFSAERKRVQRLVEVGKAADLELLRIEAAEAAAQADRVAAAEALDQAERELARVTGLDLEMTRHANLQPVTLIDSGMPLRVSLEDAARSDNQMLAAARMQRAAAESSVRAARSTRWPKLNLTASYLDFGSPEIDHTQEWNAGVQLSYPIFTGGATGSAIARADASLQAAAERERQAELEVARQLDRAIAAAQEAAARVVSLQRAADRYEEVVRIEKVRLHTGAGTQADYLDAEADLLAARAGLVQARHGEIATRVAIARITGELDLSKVSQIVEHTR